MLLKVEQMEASRREEEGDTFWEDGEGEEGEDAKEEQDEEEESEEEGEKNEEEKDEEEGEGEKDEDQDEKGQAGVEKDEEVDNSGDNQKRNPGSHHIDRKCVVPSGCRGYVGPNLKRRARCRQILCPGFGPKKDKRAQTYYKRRKDHQGEM